MGFFGGAHTDDADNCGSYSNMTCNSDIPKGYEPGFFFLFQLGVFVVLDKHLSVNFNGRRRHGGTPPIAPNGVRLCAWAYRFVVIAYPPRKIMNGSGRLSFAALPNQQAFLLPPEMPIGTTKRTTFIHEGTIMMLQTSLVTFLVRSLLLICHYFILQAPATYNLQIDTAMFLQAFTMIKDGRRVNTGPWKFAPGWQHTGHPEWVYEHNTTLHNSDAIRSAAWARWDVYEANTARHIPSIGHRGPLITEIPEPMPKPEKPVPGKCAECASAYSFQSLDVFSDVD
ncbi:hypothetical protein K438DRAFT_1619251 [Mycena galopus ATCC 62051]|nr:hypothetical protein K438DRAFT_1619251 [Mycena galopus ATCC 62051]